MISNNIEETAEIAGKFLRQTLKPSRRKGAAVVGLSGDLGAGKTAFVKAVAKHLGVKNKVNSPTFVIIRKYSIKSKTHKFLFHLDAYRLKNHEELLHLGWKDIIGNPDHLVFIEWPEHVKKAMPRGSAKVSISTDKKGRRNFKIK